MLTLFHPAYPTRNSLSAEDSAIDRDIRDGFKLDAIHQEIVDLLDRLIPYAEPLENPKLRWQPGDLIDALQEQDKSLQFERQRLAGPLFIEEAE